MGCCAEATTNKTSLGAYKGSNGVPYKKKKKH